MARLRSQGSANDPVDDASLASGRKRRAASPPNSPREDDVAPPGEGSSRMRSIMKTPSKPKKRVRFSDPGPDAQSTNTTGLTPFVSRTSLDRGMDQPAPSTPRLLARPPRRRISMPDIARPGELGSANNPIELHQFIPLRQVLTPRTRRQLKRSHLSEEMNDIEAEKRSVPKLQQEVQQLKDELRLATQLGATPSNEEETLSARRIRLLEEEIAELKQEVSPTEQDIPMFNDDDSVYFVPAEDSEPVSPAITTDDDSKMPQSPSLHTNSTAATTPAPSSPIMTSSAGVQTDISSRSISTLYSYAQQQTKHLDRARHSLERFFPDDTLAIPVSGDAGPLVDSLLSHLSAALTQLKNCKASIAASQAQHSNLHANFQASLKQLEEARAAHAKLIAERQQGKDSAQIEAEERIKQLEDELRTRNVDHNRLTAALDKYRSDIEGLEALIQGLEIEHAGAVAEMRSEKEEVLIKAKQEMNEAVADLECMVAAETRGRHEAENAFDDMELRAKEAKNRENEVREALNQKQSIVRELEASMESMKQIWAQEVGGLNARVGQLCAEVENKKDDLKLREAEISNLVTCLSAEKEAGQKSITSMKNEIDKCRQDAERIGSDYERGAYARGEQAVSALGLLTPTVEGGRFRDVDTGSESLDGRVEMGRGKTRKRKVDSGIGILLEDGGEE